MRTFGEHVPGGRADAWLQIQIHETDTKKKKEEISLSKINTFCLRWMALIQNEHLAFTKKSAVSVLPTWKSVSMAALSALTQPHSQ